jgi:putative solute:sodium symporter small subunit
VFPARWQCSLCGLVPRDRLLHAIFLSHRRGQGKVEETWEISHMSEKKSTDDYWKANLRVIKICMVIWALVSFGFAIILRPLLSGIPIGGTDLGFWFAQQGSILTFIVLIFYYTWYMNKLDKEFGVDEV